MYGFKYKHDICLHVTSNIDPDNAYLYDQFLRMDPSKNMAHVDVEPQVKTGLMFTY